MGQNYAANAILCIWLMLRTLVDLRLQTEWMIGSPRGLVVAEQYYMFNVFSTAFSTSELVIMNASSRLGAAGTGVEGEAR